MKSAIAAFAAAALLASCATAPAQTPGWTDFADLPGGPTSNRALACSEICPPVRPTRPALAFDGSVDAVAAAFARIEPGLERRAEAGGWRLRYVAVTPTLRFRDDVDVLILPAPGGGATAAIYSRSRIGLWDLGANRNRVQGLERMVSRELSRNPAQ